MLTIENRGSGRRRRRLLHNLAVRLTEWPGVLAALLARGLALLARGLIATYTQPLTSGTG
jgi:hypothetical protein